MLQRIADRFVDAYFFSSLELGEAWVRKGNLSDANKIHEVMEVSSIFHPLDKEIARMKTGVNGEPVYLWVGRLDENKDPITRVKIIPAILRILPFGTSLHDLPNE